MRLAYSLRRESNAILIYLVENYDTEHKISVTDPKEKIIQLQWLLFQASGQGSVFQLVHVNEKEHTKELRGDAAVENGVSIIPSTQLPPLIFVGEVPQHSDHM